MQKQSGFSSVAIISIVILALIVAGGAIWYLMTMHQREIATAYGNSPIPSVHILQPSSANVASPSLSPTASQAPVAGQTYGMKEYTDSQYGFTFWYPADLQVTSQPLQDTENFPGGTAIERIRIGSAGGAELYVVDSPGSTITDEPNNHASPLPQTKYFYDSTAGVWMVAFPEGGAGSGSQPSDIQPTQADVSHTTIGGLPMLASGRRFDTTIIPLTTTRFVVVTDGGGSAFTNQLAHTVAPAGAAIDASARAAALQAEANAYSAWLQYQN